MKKITKIFLCFTLLSSFSALGQTLDKKALLVIDIQENLVNPNSKIHMDTSGIDLFFRHVNSSITRFNEHQDIVVYVVNEWTNPMMNWITGNVCKKGGIGVGLDKRLIVVNDLIFSKSKSNALSNKALLKYLKDQKITEVFVTGLLAEGCVKATVQGLIKDKFEVFVIQDALGSKSQINKTKTIDFFRENEINMIVTKQQ